MGATWVFLSPIVGIIAWIFLQKTGMLQSGEVGIPYPAYVLIGTSMWGLFMGFYASSAETLSAGGALLMQVSFHHEVYFLEQNAIQVVNFAIVFLFNLLALFFFGVHPSWKTIFLPLVILPLFFLGAAIGLIVSMISAITLDVSRILSIFMGLLIWITPVIYSAQVDHALVQSLIRWNPLTYLVCSARDIVIFGRLYQPGSYALCTLGSLLLFVFSYRLFYISEKRLVERILT